jgi:hypothetical protein
MKIAVIAYGHLVADPSCLSLSTDWALTDLFLPLELSKIEWEAAPSADTRNLSASKKRKQGISDTEF